MILKWKHIVLANPQHLTKADLLDVPERVNFRRDSPDALQGPGLGQAKMW